MVYKSGQIFLPFCHNSRDGRTDRRMDRNLITIPRLHYMQRCNKTESESEECLINLLTYLLPYYGDGSMALVLTTQLTTAVRKYTQNKNKK